MPQHITLSEPRLVFGLLTLGMLGFLGMAYVLEHTFGAKPCPMCLWQRYAHGGIAVLALAGLEGRWPRLWGAAIMATAMAGLGVAMWQFAAQHQWLPFPPSCTAAGQAALSAAGNLLAAIGSTHIVPCDKETFKLLGLSLAGWNIPAMAGVIGLVGHMVWRVSKRHTMQSGVNQRAKP